MPEIGSAYLALMPSFKGFKGAIDAELSGMDTSSATAALDGLEDKISDVKSAGSDIGEGLSKGLADIPSAAESAASGIEEIADAAKSAVDQASDVGSDLKDALSGAGEAAKSAFEGIAEGGESLSGVGDAVDSVKDSMAEVAEGASLGEKAMTGLKGGLVALAGAAATIGFQAFINYLADAAKKAETFESATSGLENAARGVAVSVGAQTSAFSSYGGSINTVLPSVEELLSQQEALAQSLGGFNTDVINGMLPLSSYGDTIRELSNVQRKFGDDARLSAEDQARFTDAISKVNDATGSEFQVLDAARGIFMDQTGAIQETTAAIDMYIAKTNAAAEAQAFASAKAQIMAQAYADQAKYNNLMMQRNALEAEMNRLQSDGSVDLAMKNSLLSGYQSQLDGINSQLNPLKAGIEATKASLDGLTQAEQQAILVQEGMGTAWDNWAISNTAGQLAFAGLKYSLQDFTTVMDQAGVNLDSFANNSNVDLQALAYAFDGTFGSIAPLLQQWGIDLNNAAMNASLAYAQIVSDAEFAAAAQKVNWEEIGASQQQFAEQLQNSQIAIQDFNSLTTAQLEEVFAAYHGNFADVEGLIQQFISDNQNAANAPQEVADGAQTGTEGVEQAYEELSTAAQDAATNLQSANDQINGAMSGLGESVSSGLSSASGAISNWSSEATSLLSNASSQAAQSGTEFGSNYANGISGSSGEVSGASSSLGTSATSAISGLGGSAYSYGTEIGSNLASGMRSQVGAVQAAASELAAAAASAIQHSRPKVGPLKSGEEIFGKHIAENLARGMNDNAYIVARASRNVAQVVVDYLGHSQPAKGPLAQGEEIYGKHAMENFAEGINKGGDDVEEEIESIAQIVKDYIGHSDAAKGPLSPGEWIWGVHTATNYADGLGSAEARDAVTGAVNDLTDAAKEAWDQGILDAYKTRTQEMKDITSDLANFMAGAFSSIFDFDSFTSARGESSSVFGPHEAVYKSLEKIRKAGYKSLKEYYEAGLKYEKEAIEKHDEYAEGVAAYDKRIAEIRAQAEEKLKSGREDANKVIADREDQINRETRSWSKQVAAIQAWEAEYKQYQALRGSLDSKDLLWLAENEQIFNLQYEIEIGDSQAKEALTYLSQLSQKTGIVFSESFVKRIMEGSEEAFSLLSSLANTSVDGLKILTEAWTDYEQLQRMQEQATRELWVNSLQYTQTGTQQLRSLLLDYKDTVLDVKEAIYSDDSLASAFSYAGVSVEGFAADLESVDLTMDDFVRDFENYTERVSNGFRAMDSYSQTSYEEWKSNLVKNIAESQAYSRNVAEVFNRIPDYVDSDLFRRTVLAGGYDEWGHVMADLAKASTDELVKAVELYNESIFEAQQSSIEQFRAIAPGEEYMTAFMEGVMGQQGVLTDGTVDMLVGAADSAQDTAYPQWVSVGEYLAAGLEHGLYGKVKSITDATRALVQQTLAAAKDEAGISSPSKIFEDELGAMMGLGAVRGVQKTQPYMDRAISDLVQAPTYEPQKYAPTQTVNTEVNVYLTAEVNNEIDVEAMAHQIAYRVKQQIDREMRAVRL